MIKKSKDIVFRLSLSKTAWQTGEFHVLYVMFQTAVLSQNITVLKQVCNSVIKLYKYKPLFSLDLALDSDHDIFWGWKKNKQRSCTFFLLQ
jgi:hypothetical protein